MRKFYLHTEKDQHERRNLFKIVLQIERQDPTNGKEQKQTTSYM